MNKEKSCNPFTFSGHFKSIFEQLKSEGYKVAIPSLFQGISRVPHHNLLKDLVFTFCQKVIPLCFKGFYILGRFTLLKGFPIQFSRNFTKDDIPFYLSKSSSIGTPIINKVFILTNLNLKNLAKL